MSNKKLNCVRQIAKVLEETQVEWDAVLVPLQETMRNNNRTRNYRAMPDDHCGSFDNEIEDTANLFAILEGLECKADKDKKDLKTCEKLSIGERLKDGEIKCKQIKEQIEDIEAAEIHTVDVEKLIAKQETKVRKLQIAFEKLLQIHQNILNHDSDNLPINDKPTDMEEHSMANVDKIIKHMATVIEWETDIRKLRYHMKTDNTNPVLDIAIGKLLRRAIGIQHM